MTAKLELLLVDLDHVLDADADLQEGLARAGVPVAITRRRSDGGLALDVATYDCILVGASEPVVEALRAASDLPVPILAVSDDDELAGRLVAAGALDTLLRSDLEPSRLARRIHLAMRVRRAETASRRVADELHSERRLISAVLGQLPVGVVAAQLGSRKVVLANEQAHKLLGRQLDPHKELLAGSRAEKLLKAVADGKGPHTEETSNGKVTLRLNATQVTDTSPPLGLLTVEDVSRERESRTQVEHTLAARDELVAVVSHDLRNPLSAISLAIDELGADDLDPPARARYVQAVRRALTRANRLITDLLDVAKIDAGRLVIESGKVELCSLVEQVAREHELLASGANVKIAVDCPAQKLLVPGDRERLVQAMSNLVSNALNHGRQGGQVEIGAVAAPQGPRLWVADRGPGIPAEALPHVFDRYWQARRQRRGGAGLGLAIVKGIADAHAGRVFAENRDGGGARFVIELPA